MEVCAKIAEMAGVIYDCDYRGVMDPETGEVPCDMERRGIGCECVMKAVRSDSIAKKIRERNVNK